MYDENGEPFGFSFGGNDYYYVRNAQNDIYLIVDSNNQAVVIYQYDAWGNITHCYDTSTNDIVSTLNPYTYRGYFRDNETGFYYLKSRYYFPEFHRFICADGLVSTGQGLLSYNMFAYCLNNPINYLDSFGNKSECLKKIIKFISNKWSTIKSVLKGIGKAKNTVDAVVNIKNVNDDVKKEIYICAENMININTQGNSYKPKSHNKKILNIFLNPDLKKRNKPYSKFKSFLQAKEIPEEELNIDLNIEGSTWDELTVEQQAFVADNYLAWDPMSVYLIGVFYGFGSVKDLAEDVIVG